MWSPPLCPEDVATIPRRSLLPPRSFSGDFSSATWSDGGGGMPVAAVFKIKGGAFFNSYKIKGFLEIAKNWFLAIKL